MGILYVINYFMVLHLLFGENNGNVYTTNVYSGLK